MSEPLASPTSLPESLRQSRAWSEARLAQLRSLLAQDAVGLDAFECVAVAGSLARGEAGPGSDVDCVVVGGDAVDEHESAPAMARVLQAIEDTGLRAPRAGGFFRRVVRRAELLDPRGLGKLDESPHVYGKRLQCLLDTQPLTQPARYRALRSEVLRWFTLGQGTSAPLALLASELVRYRRSYVAYQTYDFTHSDEDSWRLRMVKLRSSRLVTVAGLLALVGESSVREDPIAYVEDRLDLSPLDRLLQVMAPSRPALAIAVAEHYAEAHGAVSAASSRRALVGEGDPVDRERLASAETTTLGVWLPPALDSALEDLARDVNDFFLTQRGHWASWFFHALLL
ncbi:MAG: nucleotidyltransferase domain-containing protein [Pseudomonadota bacterium]